MTDFTVAGVRSAAGGVHTCSAGNGGEREVNHSHRLHVYLQGNFGIHYSAPSSGGE